MAKKVVKKKVAKKAAAPRKTALRVRAKQPRRFRAGLEFSSEPRNVSVTAAQREAIEADPVLEIIEE